MAEDDIQYRANAAGVFLAIVQILYQICFILYLVVLLVICDPILSTISFFNTLFPGDPGLEDISTLKSGALLLIIVHMAFLAWGTIVVVKKDLFGSGNLWLVSRNILFTN